MTRRRRTGAWLIGLGLALVLATHFTWKFGSQSEAKAQYNRDLIAVATGVPAEDVEPNRVPAYLVGTAAAAMLLTGLWLCPLRRAPVQPMTFRFFGQPDGAGDHSDDTQ